MRLLFLSNLYPPYGQGGYEEWCKEVAEGLSTKGHQILVLTSRYGQRGNLSAGNLCVHRQLYLEMEIGSPLNPILFFTSRKLREEANLGCLRQAIAKFKPEAIVIWGMWNIPRSLPALAEALYPRRTIYYFGDYWPTLRNQWWHYWEAPARSGLSNRPKQILQSRAESLLIQEEPPVLSLPHALFPSSYMRRAYREAGMRMGRTQVVYGGVDTRPYVELGNQASAPTIAQPLKLLTVARLIPDKGVHTAIEALAILSSTYGLSDTELTIVGSGSPEYVAGLERLSQELGISQQVHRLGAVAKSEMPHLYAKHNLFIFPSIWAEPFGRVLVEAMAAKLAVVGTQVGGAGEILQDGKTGLVFPAEDSKALADQVARLAGDVSLRWRLACQGHHFALTHFDISRMVQDIEQYLMGLSD